MKLAPGQEESLNKTVKIGRNAEIAYNAYFKEYYEVNKGSLLEAFSQAKSDDIETITQIKLSLNAIIAINDAILSDIKFGEIAKQQLEDNEGE